MPSNTVGSAPCCGLDPTEDAELLARDELRRETGMAARESHHLGYLHCAKGIANQDYDVFVAAGLTHRTPELELAEQDLRQRWFHCWDVEDMLHSGTITDDSTVAAYPFYLLSEPSPLA